MARMQRFYIAPLEKIAFLFEKIKMYLLLKKPFPREKNAFAFRTNSFTLSDQFIFL